ncbi:MAG: DUF2505 domain-containing protein [Buchananella hordeovulneris]|nr:DUF2505 domain-containing protein [Buchananella hordeovulneris]
MSRFTHVDSFPAPAARIGEILTSQAFWESRVANLRAKVEAEKPGAFAEQPGIAAALTSARVIQLANGGSSLSVTVNAPASAMGPLPKGIGALVSGPLQLNVHEKWGPAQPDGSRTATLELRLEKPQATLTATVELYPTAQGCQRRVEGEIKVQVPLLGSALASKATQSVGALFAADANLVRFFL